MRDAVEDRLAALGPDQAMQTMAGAEIGACRFAMLENALWQIAVTPTYIVPR